MQLKKTVFITLCIFLIGLYFHSGDQKIAETDTATCLSYLPYDIWKNLQVDYYNWYGLEGKDIKGKTYLTGHAIQRHIAVNNTCTLQQKQQNKTIFLNLLEFQKAASNIPSLCDIPNRTTFTYDYEGKIASPTDFINGIDCKTGNKEQFPSYFVQFKRAIKNPSPTQQDYLNSNYVTVWTFYPKRLSSQNNENIEQNLKENV